MLPNRFGNQTRTRYAAERARQPTREIEPNGRHKEQKLAQLENVKRKGIWMKMEACLSVNRDAAASMLIGETAGPKMNLKRGYVKYLSGLPARGKISHLEKLC